jgi:hypothetical protein
MPTYSLTLRNTKGSKLTTTEMDNNLLYLRDLAGPTGPSYTPPYDTYTAWLSQAGINTPVITLQYNDTGSTASISRIGVGQYIISGEWDSKTPDKIFCICTGGFGITKAGIAGGGPYFGKILISTYNVATSPIALFDFGANKIYLEIRIYP